MDEFFKDLEGGKNNIHNDIDSFLISGLKIPSSRTGGGIGLVFLCILVVERRALGPGQPGSPACVPS